MNQLEHLTLLIGENVFFVPCEWGTKKPLVTYVERPFEATRTAAYRALFEVQEVNVAVYLGKASAKPLVHRGAQFEESANVRETRIDPIFSLSSTGGEEAVASLRLLGSWRVEVPNFTDWQGYARLAGKENMRPRTQSPTSHK